MASVLVIASFVVTTVVKTDKKINYYVKTYFLKCQFQRKTRKPSLSGPHITNSIHMTVMLALRVKFKVTLS